MTPFADFMKKQSLTTCGLSKRAGLSKSMVSGYRRGLHQPTRRTLTRISLALGIPLAELLCQIPVREQHENKAKPAIYCVTCHRQFYRVPSNSALYEGSQTL
jgi:transcriptional regulator with XRE-family HTH domain